FCAAESMNIDFPPRDQWMRIAVVNKSGNASQPTLRFFCDGALKVVLGPQGFNAPVSLGDGALAEPAWIAADVAFVENNCTTECVVSPIYDDPVAMTPWI